jgi:hypothetical protein
MTPSTNVVSHSGTSDVIARSASVRWSCGWRWGLLALLLGMAIALSACATGPRYVFHAFGFDAVNESKGFEVLAYSYSRDGRAIVSSDTAIRQFGKAHQGTGINGPMPVGDTLYVKWRRKSDGQAYEDKVDLRPLLPRDMHLHDIHFVVDGARLYVYLIDPDPRPPDWPVVGPRKFQHEKIRQIYPADLSIQSIQEVLQ